MNNIDVLELEKILSSGTRDNLEQFCSQNGLKIQDNKIIAQDQKAVNEAVRYWDKRQLVTKISLNSLYGAILNLGCRFFDKRIGQSTTLTGRMITQHMAAKTNEMLTGKYDYIGDTIIYGDSVTGDTIIRVAGEETTIEEYFGKFTEIAEYNGKEYAMPANEWAAEANKTISFNAYDEAVSEDTVNYVMRHKTNKLIYEIETESGKKFKVTEDHSIIVDRDGFIEEVKPTELLDNDLIICLDK